MSLPAPQELPSQEHELTVLLRTLEKFQSHDDETIRKIATAMRINLGRRTDSLKTFVDERWNDESVRMKYGADKKALTKEVLRSLGKTNQKLCDDNPRFYKIPPISDYGPYTGQEYVGLDLMVANKLPDMRLVFDALGCTDKEKPRENAWEILIRLGTRRSDAQPLFEFNPNFSLDNRLSPNAHLVAAENPPGVSFVNIPLPPCPRTVIHGSWGYDSPPRDLTQGKEVSNVKLTLATELSSLADFICTPDVKSQPPNPD